MNPNSFLFNIATSKMGFPLHDIEFMPRWSKHRFINKGKGLQPSFWYAEKYLESKKYQTQNKAPTLQKQTTLIYGAESWKITKTISYRLEVFQRKCLRRILRIFWPNTISNEDIYAQTLTMLITEEIQRRRWRWICHILRRPTTISIFTLRWNPAGKRSRGKPKTKQKRGDEQWRQRRNNMTGMGAALKYLPVTEKNADHW